MLLRTWGYYQSATRIRGYGDLRACANDTSISEGNHTALLSCCSDVSFTSHCWTEWITSNRDHHHIFSSSSFRCSTSNSPLSFSISTSHFHLYILSYYSLLSNHFSYSSSLIILLLFIFQLTSLSYLFLSFHSIFSSILSFHFSFTSSHQLILSLVPTLVQFTRSASVSSSSLTVV